MNESDNSSRDPMGNRQPADTPLRKRPVQSRAEHIVEQILLATIDLVSAHGTGKITTTLIANEIGIPVGTVYRYFKNKEAIFSTLAERYQVQKDRMAPTLEGEAWEGLSTEEFFSKMIDDLHARLRSEEGYLPLLKTAVQLPDHHKQNRDSVNRWAGAFNDMERFKGLDVPPKRRMAFFRLAMNAALAAQEQILLCPDPGEAAMLETEYKIMLTAFFKAHEGATTRR